MIGSLIAGGLSYLGARKANEERVSSARESMEFEAREAQKNRAFQERMSNTAYRRAAADLESAGLNRILALGRPASTPAGASARGVVAQIEDALTKGVSSAQHQRMVSAQVAKMKQEVANAKAQEKNLKATEKEIMMRTAKLSTAMNLDQAQSGKAHQETVNLEDQRQKLLVTTTTARQQVQVMREYLKGLRTEGKIDESTFGVIMRHVKRFTGSLLGGTAKAIPGVPKR